MEIVYSPEFDRALNDYYSYIKDQLKSPAAAARCANEILDRSEILKIAPLSGLAVFTESGKDTEIRILFSGHHAILYSIEEDAVRVSALLDMRTKESNDLLNEIRGNP